MTGTVKFGLFVAMALLSIVSPLLRGKEEVSQEQFFHGPISFRSSSDGSVEIFISIPVGEKLRASDFSVIEDIFGPNGGYASFEREFFFDERSGRINFSVLESQGNVRELRCTITLLFRGICFLSLGLDKFFIENLNPYDEVKNLSSRGLVFVHKGMHVYRDGNKVFWAQFTEFGRSISSVIFINDKDLSKSVALLRAEFDKRKKTNALIILDKDFKTVKQLNIDEKSYVSEFEQARRLLPRWYKDDIGFKLR